MTAWPLWLLGMLVAACLLGCTDERPNAAARATAERPTLMTSTATAGPVESLTPTPAPASIPSASTPMPLASTSSAPTPTAIGIDPQTLGTGLLRLVDFLDDPLGYCVDVPGFGANLQLDAPLQAHTCKPGSDDQLFAQIEGGGMRLAWHHRCLMAHNAAHGSEVGVATCGASESSQGFRLDADGRLRLRTHDGPTLCLGVAGGSGEPAGGRNHLRRDLTLYRCDGADQSLITWMMEP